MRSTQCSRQEGVTRIINGCLSSLLHKNIHCDPSLEPSRQDGSNEGSQCMFSLRNKKKTSLNYRQYPLLSLALSMERTASPKCVLLSRHIEGVVRSGVCPVFIIP